MQQRASNTIHHGNVHHLAKTSPYHHDTPAASTQLSELLLGKVENKPHIWRCKDMVETFSNCAAPEYVWDPLRDPLIVTQRTRAIN